MQNRKERKHASSGRTGTVQLVRQIDAVVKVVAAHGRLKATGQIASEFAGTAKRPRRRIRVGEKRRRAVSHRVMLRSCAFAPLC